ELNNRPDWVRIPLQGILSLIDQAAAAPAPPVVPAPAGSPPETIAASLLSDFDLYLLAEGTHYRSFDKLGAHVIERNGRAGTNFAVWAPQAREVSVVGDFNGWDTTANLMQWRGQ